MFKKRKPSKDDKVLDEMLSFSEKSHRTENNFDVVNPDDYFVIKNDFQEGSNNQNAIGRNSVVGYQNKYVSTGRRLASSEVVDISAFSKKKEVSVVDDTPKEELPQPEEEKKEESAEEEDDIFSFFKDDGSEDDIFGDDFWNFGETDVKDSVKEEIKEEEKVVEVKPEPVAIPVVQPKPVVQKQPRKKKRAIDIDIISGGSGGDII